MKRKKPIYPAVLIVIVLLATSLAAVVAAAQNGLLDAVYKLDWWTVDGGGGRLDGDDYVLLSTAGQFDAAPGLPVGDRYTLQSGFWPGGSIEESGGHAVYLPLVIRE